MITRNNLQDNLIEHNKRINDTTLIPKKYKRKQKQKTIETLFWRLPDSLCRVWRTGSKTTPWRNRSSGRFSQAIRWCCRTDLIWSSLPPQSSRIEVYPGWGSWRSGNEEENGREFFIYLFVFFILLSSFIRLFIWVFILEGTAGGIFFIYLFVFSFYYHHSFVYLSGYLSYKEGRVGKGWIKISINEDLEKGKKTNKND